MKKFQGLKMMLLGLLAMGSTNAFAGVGLSAHFVKNGVVYETSNVNSEKLTADAVAWGISDNAEGLKLTKNEKPTEIPATLTVAVDGEDWAVTVKGVDAGFASNGVASTEVAKVTTVSIDITNFSTVPDFSSAGMGFTGLKNLTIKDGHKTALIAALPTLESYAKLETLDIENCPGITTITAKGFSNLKAIKVPATLTTVDPMAFKGCSKLTAFPFGENLTSVGTQAFQDTGLTAADLSKTKLSYVLPYTFWGAPLATVTLPEELKEISSGAFKNTKLTSIDIPKTVTYIGAEAFSGVETLTTVTQKEDVAALQFVGSEAFAKTKITTFRVHSGVVKDNAFKGCNMLTSFYFEDPQATDVIENNAFIGCIPFVTIYTPEDYIKAHPTAPTNCQYEVRKAVPVLEIVGKFAVKNGFAKWYDQGKDIIIDAAKYKAFSVYVDNGGKLKDGTAYFQGLKIINGWYYIPRYTHILIQPLEGQTEVEYGEYSATDAGSILVDEIFTFNADCDFADFQTGTDGVMWSTAWPFYKAAPWNSNMYLYRLTNNGGVGFSFFTGTTLKGGTDNKAQFFIQSIKKPTKSGRLNVVWLDEDGNVIEGNATAIEKIENAVEENGAIYNLAGQKVDASYKGVVIKNGKKVMQ